MEGGVCLGGRGEGGGLLDRKYVLDLMRGRSRMTIDPRIPTMPGRGWGERWGGAVEKGDGAGLFFGLADGLFR